MRKSKTSARGLSTVILVKSLYSRQIRRAEKLLYRDLKKKEKEKKYNVIGATHAVLRPLLLDRCTYTSRYDALRCVESIRQRLALADRQRAEGRRDSNVVYVKKRLYITLAAFQTSPRRYEFNKPQNKTRNTRNTERMFHIVG